MDDKALKLTVKARKLGSIFFARPCDDGRKPDWAWCVEEIEVKPDLSIRWASTLYEAVLTRAAKGDESIAFAHMTKAQAKREAVLWQQDYDARGFGLPKKRGWRGCRQPANKNANPRGYHGQRARTQSR